MISFQTFLFFTSASILIAIVPGPDNLYVLSQGISRGKKAAIATTCGLCSGIIVHTTAAIFGANIIFKTSQFAFNTLKFAGAAYLFYLGYKTFKHRNDSLTTINDKSKSLKVSFKTQFIRGFFMNVLNPKVALFFLTLFSPFVQVNGTSVTLQMISLGLIFMASAFIVFSTLGLLSGYISGYILKNKQVSKTINILTSIFFIGIGVKLIILQK